MNRLVMLPVFAAAFTASADIVEMSDGRRFEGEIVGETASVVSLDTRVTATIRTTLRLDRSDITSIERTPLPDDYFDPPPVAPRISEPTAQEADETLYLEIPIRGAFGREIFADGINRVVRYARRYRIRHLVFVIDSDGGDLDEVMAVYDVLRNNRAVMHYDAVIANCTGGGLAIPVWCDSIHLLPGARIGGSRRAWAESSAGDRREEDEVLRSQIANDVIRQAGLDEVAAAIFRAMIVPATTLAAWRDDQGEIVLDREPPATVPADRVIFRVGAGELLVLDEKQAVQIGLESFDGVVQELGTLLGYAGWRRESDYGRQAMQEVLEHKTTEAADATARHNAKVEENIRTRRAAEQYLQESLQQAAEWNPGSESYEYYSRRWGWGWGGHGKLKMTSESRRMWTRRVDNVLGYLREAAKAATALERLDREAVKLGLDPTFTPQDLAWIKDDIQTKYDYYTANRVRQRWVNPPP